MNAKNYIQISGRLTTDPAPNKEQTYARFSIAHNFGPNTEPLYMNCVIFEKEFKKNGQTIPWDLLRRGQEVLLTGRLRPNNWTDNDGGIHKGIDIIVNKIRDAMD